MTAANVELIRQVYESFVTAQSFEDLRPTVERFVDPEVGWMPIEDPGPHHGHSGVERTLNRWFESMEEFEVEVEDVVDLGDLHVLGVTRHVARGRGSGVAVAQRVYPLFTISGQKIAKFQEFRDRDKAEAAARAG